MSAFRNTSASASTKRFTALAEAVGRVLPVAVHDALVDELGRWGWSPDHVTVRAFPYSGALTRLWWQGRQVRLGLHPALVAAPEEVFRAALRHLFRRARGIKPEPQDRERVTAYFTDVGQSGPPSPAPRPAAGRHHDLARLLRRVSERFFDSTLHDQPICWSRRGGRGRLAWFHPSTGLIEVNRLLDRPDVPERFLEFLVYHELLHALLGAERQGRRMVFHHGRFRHMERAFPDYEWVKGFQPRVEELMAPPPKWRRPRVRPRF